MGTSNVVIFRACHFNIRKNIVAYDAHKSARLKFCFEIIRTKNEVMPGSAMSFRKQPNFQISL